MLAYSHSTNIIQKKEKKTRPTQYPLRNFFYQLSCEFLSKYPPLALREAGLILAWPGELGRDVVRPASDRKGVVGSFMEISFGEDKSGAFSPWTSFSKESMRIGGGRPLRALARVCQG